MKLLDLIRNYERSKSVHQPLSDSLGSKLVQLRDVFGQLPADASGDTIARLAQQRWGTGSQGTVKRQLAQVRAVLNHARNARLISDAPHIEMPAVNDARVIDVTASQAEALLDLIEIAHPAEYPMALLLTHTGVRLGEALALTGDDFGADWIIARKSVARRTKTVSRLIPLSRRLREAIELYSIKPASGQTLGNYLGYANRPQASYRIGQILDETCRQLAMTPLRVHDLRHVFAAIIAEKGGDLADIATLLGHTNLSTTLRYRSLVRVKATRLLDLV